MSYEVALCMQCTMSIFYFQMAICNLQFATFALLRQSAYPSLRWASNSTMSNLAFGKIPRIMHRRLFSAAKAHGRLIDLRSDTVTRPTLQMKEAIFNAEVRTIITREHVLRLPVAFNQPIFPSSW